jgi:outer membrane protein OmpA-like peptidoglycan-associated protein
MTSHKISTSFLRFGTVFAVTATALGGCSTVKSISPFGSNVPYAQNIQPTITRPAVTEIPAFKPKPESPPPAPKPPAPVVASPAPPPPPAPSPEPAPTAAPAAEAPTPAAPPAKASAAQVPAPKVAEAEPAEVPQPAKSAVTEKAANEHTKSEKAAERDLGEGPSIPASDRKLSEDGAYPNLAQVPARPVNLPTFAEAAALEKSLVKDRDTAKDSGPASAEALPVDSAPASVSQDKSQAQPVVAKMGVVTARAEDHAPCLNGTAVDGALAATFHFDPGSAALTAGNQALLAEAMPTVRAAKGTIRIFGHGDTGTASVAARFDLAAARAAAVAQAVAGYGIPAPRIAVGIACADAAFSGASVQLYAES